MKYHTSFVMHNCMHVHHLLWKTSTKVEAHALCYELTMQILSQNVFIIFEILY
jgi:hypothetical protein